MNNCDIEELKRLALFKLSTGTIRCVTEEDNYRGITRVEGKFTVDGVPGEYRVYVSGGYVYDALNYTEICFAGETILKHDTKKSSETPEVLLRIREAEREFDEQRKCEKLMKSLGMKVDNSFVSAKRKWWEFWK